MGVECRVSRDQWDVNIRLPLDPGHSTLGPQPSQEYEYEYE
jgi:hypothetical protein